MLQGRLLAGLAIAIMMMPLAGASPVAMTEVGYAAPPGAQLAAGGGPAAVTVASQGAPGTNAMDLATTGVFFGATRTDPATTGVSWVIVGSAGTGTCNWPAGGALTCTANVFAMTGHVSLTHNVAGTGTSVAVYTDGAVGAAINMII